MIIQWCDKADSGDAAAAAAAHDTEDDDESCDVAI